MCPVIWTKCLFIDSTFLVTVWRDNCKSFIADKMSDLFLKFSNKAPAPSEKVSLLYEKSVLWEKKIHHSKTIFRH